MLESDYQAQEREDRDWTRYQRDLQWSPVTPKEPPPLTELRKNACCGGLFRTPLGMNREGQWFRCLHCSHEWSELETNT